MAGSNQTTQQAMPDSGTLATLPLELRYNIISQALNVKVAINEDGSEGEHSTRQALPPSLEQDIQAMGGIPIESCTYIIRSPAAFHAFYERLSVHNRRRLRSLRLVLFASLDQNICSMETPAFEQLMDPGWRQVFRTLPGTIQHIILDVTSPPIEDVDEDYFRVSKWLGRYSTLMYMKSKGTCRFVIEGCQYFSAQFSFETVTANVINSPIVLQDEPRCIIGKRHGHCF
ncbi:MAG: hypothetical protein M1812_000710 [Candelaria pacifica]|nr:MAG: hypothetical protein M1812_000710 [Candelaria pacifica]